MPLYGYPFKKSVWYFGTENPKNPMVYRVKSRPPVTARIVKTLWSKKGMIWRDYRLPSFKKRGSNPSSNNGNDEPSGEGKACPKGRREQMREGLSLMLQC